MTSACKHCGSSLHTSLMCFFKPRKAIKHEAIKSYEKRKTVALEWYADNPPNSSGQWECYLQISSSCPIFVTRETITLEHVKSKARYPGLRYDKTNLKPACQYCNKIKGSRDIEDLIKLHPHLAEIEI